MYILNKWSIYLNTNPLRFIQDEKLKVIRIDGINTYFKVITYNEQDIVF